ncbi:hypothetical protein [Nocardioides deserti]|uniref:Pyrroloquinoline-quinone binding quinoprotein n=1 Tax=Nocardioides deserti TaxID=1588644 RepID=A0ABR6U6X9_9ACTN|nr:hypothetical protein [Nocardioides deserti]MBC2959724.1 hypothetical protein [Nocardioides deserti]GGO74384.1 hypothetical protein GCM10012276_22280 [Nocardioides deserti]
MRGGVRTGARSRAAGLRFPRTIVLVALAALTWALGPLVVLVALLILAVPRVRRWWRPTWRVVAGWVVGVLALVGVVVVLPDGLLPIPPGAGAAVTPGYTGRPFTAQPVELDVPQHPFLAPNGLSSMHHDAWATDATVHPGPLGESPRVETAWYGVEECATLAFDSHERLVALCGDLQGPRMHVLDPESMRPLVSKDLPDRPDVEGKQPWENLCAGAYFYLDAEDRAVVATTDRRVLVVATSDADGDADLTTEATHDLGVQVPADDCLIAVLPDWQGRIWFVTQDGRTGFVEPGSGDVAVLELGEEVANSFATDTDGAVYVVTTAALYRLEVSPAGLPRVRWRTPYDRGSRLKPGQVSQGSGTTPTILPGGVVAITDNAGPRMHVQMYGTRRGRLICQEAVFGDDASATDNSLVSVGTGVVVENNADYTGPWRTMLGRTTPGGFARVDLVTGEDGERTCETVWTSEVSAPTSVPKLSLATGLLYAYEKRSSVWGASAWYLVALDVRTGRTAYRVRTGIGALFNNHYAAVTLAPDGSAYVATLAGMVRVRDRED